MDPTEPGSTVFQFIGGSIEQTTADFLLPALAAMCAWLKIVLVPACGLYIVCLIGSVLIGRARSFGDILVPMLKIIVIGGLVTSADIFGLYVLDAFVGFESDVAVVLSLNGADGIYATLDASMSRSVEIAQLCFAIAGEAGRFDFGPKIAWTFCALLVTLGGGALTAIGGAIIVGAKLVLMLAFAAGPLFVAFAIFPPTQRFLDAWIAQVFAQVLKVLFVCVALVVSMALLGNVIERATFTPDVAPWGSMTAIFIALVMLGVLVRNVSSFAAGLSGGMSLQDAGLSQMIAPAKIAGSAARLTNGGPVTRRDLSTGHLVSGSRTAHFLAGNTDFNLAYAKDRAGSIGRNWSMWNSNSAAPGGSVAPGGTPKP